MFKHLLKKRSLTWIFFLTLPGFGGGQYVGLSMDLQIFMCKCISANAGSGETFIL